jgi:hypothetical protein
MKNYKSGTTNGEENGRKKIVPFQGPRAFKHPCSFKLVPSQATSGAEARLIFYELKRHE